MSSPDHGKMSAAAAALQFVEDGMVIGLGTGSTANHFIRMLGERVARGLNVRGIPTSEATRSLALASGISLMELDQAERIHLTVDGADEIDPNFTLIKGGGGALLREKIIATSSDHMLVIADDTKAVDVLGAFPLPVEVAPFGFTQTAKRVYEAMKDSGTPGLRVGLREAGGSGKPFLTDGGHFILDCHCEEISNPVMLARSLSEIPGVMEHGLFIDIARTVILGSDVGARILEQ